MNGRPTAPASLFLLRDFPDRLPAMVVKELRQGLRSPMFVAPFAGVHVAAILAVGKEYLDGDTRDFSSPFWIVAAAVVGFLMPLRGFTALREECVGGNSALLLLGGLSRWQIVRGKWLVQIMMCGLLLISLLPYMLVRYFLGGMEIIPNVLMAGNVFGMSAGISGCVIGASGYASPTLRFIVAGLGGFWIILAALFTTRGIEGMERMAGGAVESLIFGVSYVCALGIHLLFAVIGLQLGRAHLKVYLRPEQVPPTRGMVAVLIFLPGILFVLAVVSLGWGFPVVLAAAILIMCRRDRCWHLFHGAGQRYVGGLHSVSYPLWDKKGTKPTPGE